MKVLLIYGGITNYASALLRKLRSKGVEIVVLTPSETNTIGKGVKLLDDNEGYRHVQTTEKKSWYGKAKLMHVAEYLETEKPHVLVIGWPYFLQLFFEPQILRTIRKHKIKLAIREIPFQTPPYKKVVSYYRSHPVYDEQMRLQSKGLLFYLKAIVTMFIRKWCYARADGSLNYTTVAYDILPSYGLPLSKIHVTYNTGDDESLRVVQEKVKQSDRMLPLNSQRILHVGRLVKWKQVDLLIRSFCIVLSEFPQAELVIIGDGPEMENLKQQVKTLGIDEHVIFTGEIYDPFTLGKYMNESEVYVLAGMGGLSINDAMLYGLPVICSVCDGTEKDLLTDQVNGLFFESQNAVDLADKIKYVLHNPEKAKKMGEYSRKLIDEKINLNTVSDNYMNAFNSMLQ